MLGCDDFLFLFGLTVKLFRGTFEILLIFIFIIIIVANSSSRSSSSDININGLMLPPGGFDEPQQTRVFCRTIIIDQLIVSMFTFFLHTHTHTPRAFVCVCVCGYCSNPHAAKSSYQRLDLTPPNKSGSRTTHKAS